MRIAVWSDHPGLTTGFANVARPFIDAFIERGWQVFILGRLQTEPVPYKNAEVFPVSQFDPDGLGNLRQFIVWAKPDIIWIVGGPGLLRRWIDMPKVGLKSIIDDMCDGEKLWWMDKPKIVSYMPIEGTPIYRLHREAFESVSRWGGKCVLYSPGSVEKVKQQFGDQLADGLDWVYHGLDHAEFRPYSARDRTFMRKMCGLDDYTVFTSVGANKRVKAFPEIIYAAVELKKMGVDDIVIYLHTDAEEPLGGAFSGHDLKGMAQYYDVSDIVLFKPTLNSVERGHTWIGVDYNQSAIKQLRDYHNMFGYPKTSQDRGNIFSYYSYIDIAAITDYYLDLSHVEGWGLPMGEFMACGVPTLGLKDGHIRDEVYSSPGRIEIEPLPERLWGTHHTGARLVKCDPVEVAKAMIAARDRKKSDWSRLSKAALMTAGRYKWSNSIEKMTRIIEGVKDA